MVVFIIQAQSSSYSPMKTKKIAHSYCVMHTFLFKTSDNLVHLTFTDTMPGRKDGNTIGYFVAGIAHLLILFIQTDILVVIRLGTHFGQKLQQFLV